MDHKFDTKIFVIDESLQGQKFESLTLRHPGTAKPAQFLLSDNKLYEIMTFNEKNRSWFIDDSVASNGLIYMPMPFDPLYIAISYLMNCDSKKVEPLDYVLVDEEFPETKKLMSLIDMKALSKVAEQVGPEDLNAFKYNEEKVLEWLKKKCLIVVEALKKSNVRTGQNVTSQTFVNVTDTVDENSYLSTAHGIVSEYITSDLSTKLATFMNIQLESKSNNGTKRKSLVDLENSINKKSRLEEDIKLEKIPETKDDKKAKQKNEKLAKAATGSKNIMSFFTKK
ncbi:ribonuclease H2 subunit B [Culicoides brevitarsis]|uniref:ribonuclease H2 subunit B n=1 Tax=Culicoides brevitarsis TaxID=469753 RepID=UPI00307B1939